MQFCVKRKRNAYQDQKPLSSHSCPTSILAQQHETIWSAKTTTATDEAEMARKHVLANTTGAEKRPYRPSFKQTLRALSERMHIVSQRMAIFFFTFYVLFASVRAVGPGLKGHRASVHCDFIRAKKF